MLSDHMGSRKLKKKNIFIAALKMFFFFLVHLMFFSTALDFIKGQVCTNSLHDSAARRSRVNGCEVGPSDENDATTWVKEECVLNSSRFSHVAALCTEEGYTARRMKRRLLSLPKAGFSSPPHSTFPDNTRAVLFFPPPETRCLPRCSATQPRRSWERGVGGPLINIQLVSESTHAHTHTQTPQIFTNTQSDV